ncbi:leucine-rich repeat neuronal protein 4 isoform X2 [Danio aesculapii]|uniref:leucine-rich repeat neuronal protein 4 isoform X2 n=1 Tax=Danio aesculapii TaxID=1142201 RepID=UPI0024C01192|nr:leucine-rich repeat neuronal protein 4 isoform X2 [Danio aesculapii]
MGVMLVCGRPVTLLFLISFLHFSFVSSSSSASTQNATRPRSPHSEAMRDYDEYDEETTTASPRSSSTGALELNPCDYDMCVEQRQTCMELAEVENCLCPGLSDLFTRPSPPRISDLIQQGGRGVEVNWCAPTSLISSYNVRVKGNGKVISSRVVEQHKRALVLEDVEAGAVVCVEAENNGGISDQSCANFEPKLSDSGLALKLGIIGGVVGLILLLILALLLWRHKKRQKLTARSETEGVL